MVASCLILEAEVAITMKRMILLGLSISVAHTFAFAAEPLQLPALEQESLSKIFAGQLNAESLRLELKKLHSRRRTLIQQKSREKNTSSFVDSDLNKIEAQIASLETVFAELQRTPEIDGNQLFPNINDADLESLHQLGEQGVFNMPAKDYSFREKFELRDSSQWPEDDSRAFALTSADVNNYSLELINMEPLEEFSSNHNDSSYDDRNEGAFIAEMNCDKPFTLERTFDFDLKNVTRAKFTWYHSKRNGQRLTFKPMGKVGRCTLRFENMTTGRRHQVHFIAEEVMYPQLADLTRRVEPCLLPTTSQFDPVGFFVSANFKHLTCTTPVPKIRALKHPYLALNMKVKALLGQTIPVDVMDSKDAAFELDYSKAPKLDAIYISSLNFKNDYYGRIIANLIEYHAQQGTPVRILVPEVSIRSKDAKLLSELEKSSYNIKILRYQFESESYGLGDFVNSLHRVNHTKLFITYSASQPESNVVITGGRNIRDSYLFKSAPNHHKFKDFIQYSDKEEPFIYYEDMEIRIEDPQFTKEALAQALSLFAMNYPVQSIRPTQIQVKVNNVAGPVRRALDSKIETETYVRHIVSVPYADNKDLEKFFVGLFDSARREIRIVSPYFRPTKNIFAALDRAVQRGVKIWVLTRLNLAGDDIPKIVGDVNRETINKTFTKMTIYEWADPQSIMHSKFILIDDNLSFLGGVNLNGRSFIHDLEGGAMVLGKPFNQTMLSIYESYLEGSNHITAETKISAFNRFLIEVGKYFF